MSRSVYVSTFTIVVVAALTALLLLTEDGGSTPSGVDSEDSPPVTLVEPLQLAPSALPEEDTAPPTSQSPEQLTTLPLGAVLVGQVLTEDGMPLVDVTVEVFTDSQPEVWRRTDSTGSFRVGFPVGVEVLTVNIGASPTTASERVTTALQLEPGEEQQRVYRVGGRIDESPEKRNQRSLHLRAVDATGEPIANLSLWIRDRNGEPLSVPLGPYVSSSGASTNEVGEVLLHELPAASIRLLARRADARELRFEAGPLHHLDFNLRTQPVGIQEVVIPDDPPPTLRTLVITIIGVSEHPQAPLLEDEAKPNEIEQLRRRYEAGEIWPLARDLVLRFTTAEGAKESARLLKNDEGAWSFTGKGGNISDVPGYFYWHVPLGAGTLELTALGLGKQIIEVPEGLGEVSALFFFKER